VLVDELVVAEGRITPEQLLKAVGKGPASPR
jgi:hypothetical protein